MARFTFIFTFSPFCFGRQWRRIVPTGFGRSGRAGKECVGAFAVVCTGRRRNKLKLHVVKLDVAIVPKVDPTSFLMSPLSQAARNLT